MIIFVPGIKGSELFDGDNKRWFPSTQKDVDLLNIKNELKAERILGRVRPYGIKPLDRVIYQGILDEFSADILSIFPYDWRQSVFSHVEALTDKIIDQSTASGEKVILIAHSMGGILSKLAIKELNNRGEIDKIEKFVTIGTPWHGAPDSFKALLYGEPGIFDNFKEILQFLTVEGTRKLARMLPSVYQLLPSEKYFTHEDGKFILTNNNMDITYETFKSIIQNLHDQDKGENEFVDVWRTYIEPLHEAMQEDLPAGMVQECLIGHSEPTLYTVPENSKIGIGKKRYKHASAFKNGDGVVPIHSAIPDHAANLYFIKGEHSKLCSIEGVIEFIKWIINNKTSELPDGIIPSTLNDIPVNSRLKAGFLAKIMCPVESTILDEEGKYIAGVFDTSINEISDLAGDENVRFYSIGESKYVYFADQKEEDLIFDIQAYEEGIASVSIEVYEEEKSTEVRFETIPVSNESSAKLKIPANNIIEESIMEFDGSTIHPTVRQEVESDLVSQTPVPTIKIGFEPIEGVQKVPYRNTFSGIVKLQVESNNLENISELFYSVNGENIQKYVEGALLNLNTGEHIVEMFGKDIYDRPLTPTTNKLSIDNQAPKTKVRLLIEPEAIYCSFKGVSNNSNLETKYRFTAGADVDEELEWKTTESDNKISVPRSWLLRSPNNTVIVEFFTVNKDFGLTEPRKSFVFSLGDIPILMWEDTTQAVTPSMIWDTLFQHGLFDISEFKVNQLVQNKYTDIGQSDIIGDNVKGIKYESVEFIIVVMFSEKYSLFFSGPPTELLKLDQEYEFSFELKTERSNESITTTNPKARLHPIKAPRLADTIITLREENGVFKGKFKVDSNFKNHKHKLIITDVKNIAPPLREISLLLDEDNE